MGLHTGPLRRVLVVAGRPLCKEHGVREVAEEGWEVIRLFLVYHSYSSLPWLQNIEMYCC